MAELSPQPSESNLGAQWAYSLVGDGIKYALRQVADWPIHQGYFESDGSPGIVTALSGAYWRRDPEPEAVERAERLLVVARRNLDDSAWTAGVATGGMRHPVLSYNLQPSEQELERLPAASQAQHEQMIWRLTRVRGSYEPILSEQLLGAIMREADVSRRWLGALGLTAVDWAGLTQE